MNGFDILENHEIIGLDFDGTLIDHPSGVELQNFVHENHLDKQIYIITFRSGSMLVDLWDDMKEFNYYCPSKRMFKGVYGIEHSAWQANEIAMLKRRSGMIGEDLTDEEIYYKTWKGMMCNKLGATVLVDDKPGDVMLGCKKFGIQFVHIDQF